MGQRLYFCTFTQIPPLGYNSRDGMQAAWKAGSGLGAALCCQQALQGARPLTGCTGPAQEPPGRGCGARRAPQQGRRAASPSPGLRPGQGPLSLVAPRPPCLAVGSGTWGSTSAARPHSCSSVVKPAHQPLPPSRK